MRKCRTILGTLLLLSILLSSSGCFFRAKYNVFSDKEHTITHVSSSNRDYIGIVLDSEELVICDYKGNELCRKQFEKSITNLDVFSESVLLRFSDDSIEMYRLENNDIELNAQREFSSPIKMSEIVRRTQEHDGYVVLLENGDLFLFKDQSNPDESTPIEKHVKTAACLDDYFVYITDDGKVELIWQGSPVDFETEIDLEIACDIKELKLADLDGKEGFLGIGKNQIYYLSGIAPLTLDTKTDISNIDPDSVLSGKALENSVIYLEDGNWYYEGIMRDYESQLFRKDRRRIKPKDDEAMLPIPGGVIFYTDHNVRIQLI